MKFVNKYLKDNITLKNNKIELTPETTRAIKRFNRVMDKFFQENKSLEKYLVETTKLLGEASGTTLAFHQGQVSGFNDSRIRASQNLIANEYLDSLNGLNEEFKNPVRRSIVDNLTNGSSLTDITNELKTLIKGKKGKSGLMKRYLESNARIAANAYTGNTSQFFYQKYKDRITHVGVSGTLIKTSAPQCVKSIIDYKKRVPVDKFKDDILKIAKSNGLIEGTTIENVWINTLHWGCRHSFTPLIN